MPDFYPDILETLGKTPRELGALHVHVEPVALSASLDAVATIWLQAAFEPQQAGTLRIVGADAEGTTVVPAEHLWHRLPALSPGQVVRWRIPFRLSARTAELMFLVDAPPARKAERVRQAWKLFDTMEQVKLSDLGPPPPLFDGEYTDPKEYGGLTLIEQLTMTRHPARQLPPGFVASVVAGEVSAQESVEVIWRPGDSLPAAPAPSVDRPVPPRERICMTCLHRARSDELDDRLCPQCGDPWG